MYRHPPRVEPGAWALVLVVALVALAGGVLAWPAPDGVPASSGRSSDPSLELHRNPTAGYEVRHPEDWTATDAGTVTRLVSPDRDTVVALGVGPEGSLAEASDRLVGSLQESYREVTVSEPEEESIFGYGSLVVGGTATNAVGDRLRFLAVVVDAPDRNYAMTVFVPEGADVARVVPDLRRIVDSFRPPPA